MKILSVYQGAALATYEKIQSKIENIYINKVYQSKTAKCLFFINNKGYMHILTPARCTMNGKTIGYILQDHILSKDNAVTYKGDYTKIYNTVQELQKVINEMLNA